MPEDREHARPLAVRVEVMTAGHAPAVLETYQAGMDTGDATFETTCPAWAEFDGRHLREHRFVATSRDGDVVGWVAAVAVSTRRAYAGVIEHSVYVAPGWSGRGVGTALMQELIRSADQSGVWTIQTGVFPENAASLALHARTGFRVVGVRERIGQRDGRWRDVVLLERRNPRI
jgi:phosphinothricin acetyltransferase